MNIVERELQRKFIEKREQAIKAFFVNHSDASNDDRYLKDLVLIRNTSRKAFDINGNIVKHGDMALLPRNSAETFMRMLGCRFDIIENPTVASLTTLQKEAV